MPTPPLVDVDVVVVVSPTTADVVVASDDVADVDVDVESDDSEDVLSPVYVVVDDESELEDSPS